MAHEIPDINWDDVEKLRKVRKVTLPDIQGKFGISISVGRKEIFIGVAIAKIELETVIRKKKMKTNFPNGKNVRLVNV